MIVVSNTSPLTNLAAIGRFDMLRYLFGTIHIAEGVWAELNAQGRAWPGAAEVAASDWIFRHEVQDRNLVRALRRDLDRGEAETIALMLELKADVGIVAGADPGSAPDGVRRIGSGPASCLDSWPDDTLTVYTRMPTTHTLMLTG